MIGDETPEEIDSGDLSDFEVFVHKARTSGER